MNKQNDFDVSTELEGYGLQGVRVTDEDLRLLVEELGLEGDDAEDMVRSLGGDGNEKDTNNNKDDKKVNLKEAITSKDT